MNRPGSPGYEHGKEPPGRQNFTSAVRNYCSILVFARVDGVEPVTTDRYRRTVAFVKVGDTVIKRS